MEMEGRLSSRVGLRGKVGVGVGPESEFKLGSSLGDWARLWGGFAECSDEEEEEEEERWVLVSGFESWAKGVSEEVDSGAGVVEDTSR